MIQKLACNPTAASDLLVLLDPGSSVDGQRDEAPTLDSLVALVKKIKILWRGCSDKTNYEERH